jgi:tetratricopeptide (TPR) repeat protein
VGPDDRWPSMDALAGELERLAVPQRPRWRVEPGGLRRGLLRGLEWVRAMLSTEPRAGAEVEAALLAGIGVLLCAQGRHEEALDHHRRALAMFEQVLGPGHPNVALSHASIGAVLHEQGKREEALLHRRQAQAIYERALGEDHPQRAHLLRGLADDAPAGHGPDEAREHR